MVTRKSSRIRRPRKLIRRKISIAIFAVMTVALPFLLAQLSFKNDNILYSKSSAVGQLNMTEEVNSTSTSKSQEEHSADITKIEDASSEQNGHWRGLCRKRSVDSVEDFRRTVASDPVLSGYFSGFNWEASKIGSLEEETKAIVAHRKGDVIKMTSKPIKLPRGDGYITDGVRTVRTFCCNEINLTPSAGVPGTAPPLPLPPTGIDAGEGPSLPWFVPIAGINPVGSLDPSPRRDPPPVPEPGTMILMGTGLLVGAALLRQRNGYRRGTEQKKNIDP